MPAAARLGDMHTCPVPQHTGGPVALGSATVMIGGQPAARVGDVATCAGPPDAVIQGSPTVLVDFMPAARQGDATAHGGVIAQGDPSVLIGTPAQAAVLIEAAERGAPFCEVCERGRQR